MIGWFLFASLIGLIAGFALGIVAAYYGMRWYDALPEKVVMGRKLRSKTLDAAYYEGENE